MFGTFKTNLLYAAADEPEVEVDYYASDEKRRHNDDVDILEVRGVSRELTPEEADAYVTNKELRDFLIQEAFDDVDKKAIPYEPEERTYDREHEEWMDMRARWREKEALEPVHA